MARYIKLDIEETVVYSSKEKISEPQGIFSDIEVVRILNEQEEKEFKAEIIEECKNQLLLHLAEVIYRQNDYPIRAVPQTIILSLPSLMKMKSEVNDWKREFAWEWFKKDLVLNGEDNEIVIKYKQLFEQRWKEWKEQGNG